MKKSLVALAVLASFGGAAFAQSSVTLYGLIDQGIQRTNGGTATSAGTVAGAAGKAWQLRQSASSRLGFRGTEDLGGGLSAQFQIEHRFTPDDGASGSIFWAGRSWVQLTKDGVGSVYLGRQYLPTFWVQFKADPFGQDGVGQFGPFQQNAGFSRAAQSGSDTRASNAVGFKSANFGGVSGEVQVGLAEGAVNGRSDSFNVVYQGGPIYVGLGYARIKGGSIGVDGNKLITGTVAYDLGVVELLGNYGEAKLVNGTQKHKTGSFGAAVPLAGGKVKALYGVYDPAGANNRQKKFGLGYDYPLSKRTNIYADLGVAKEPTKTRNTAYAFGVKHLF